MILDTSFVIDIMRNEPKALEKAQELLERGEPLLVTAVTIFELFSGIMQSNKPVQEKNKILKTLQGQLIVHFDNDAAEKAGELHGTLVRTGNTLDPLDCMIAGIALTKREKVLTKNEKHFSRARGLEIETY